MLCHAFDTLPCGVDAQAYGCTAARLRDVCARLLMAFAACLLPRAIQQRARRSLRLSF